MDHRVGVSANFGSGRGRGWKHLFLIFWRGKLVLTNDLTKVLTNDLIKTKSLHIDGKAIEILQSTGHTEYLGRKLCLGSLHDTEVDARLDKAWKKLFSMKSELCGRHAR